jgi:hypothetical protein
MAPHMGDKTGAMCCIAPRKKTEIIGFSCLIIPKNHYKKLLKLLRNTWYCRVRSFFDILVKLQGLNEFISLFEAKVKFS